MPFGFARRKYRAGHGPMRPRPHVGLSTEPVSPLAVVWIIGISSVKPLIWRQKRFFHELEIPSAPG